ncbi:DUF6612 family protein [Piscibacillus halophilus]|uniref:Uncharacterized protein n=1 Tax=Piscibacillus halophilus TaxID=571933 RepID=A0A1H9JI05_9BACI|nr:DUF6612 family protein [Piscibacillus halophilus]SEQ86419.1 hypothetical protein SAMN05216362_1314 [Piscibacillus halophilus]
MKKIIIMFGVLILLITGCSNEKKTSETSAEDIFNKALTESEKVENVMVDFSLVQEVKVPEVDQPIKVEQQDTTYLQNDPLEFITELHSPYGQFTLLYTNDQLYSDESEGTYKEISNDELNQLPEHIQNQRHLHVLLDYFAEFKDQFEIKRDDQQFVLSLSGNGEDFQSYVKNQIETSALGSSELPIEESELKINEVNININIDQESYEVASISTDFDSEIHYDDQSTITQKIERTYYDYNQQTKEIPEVD